jgi:GT2 family glycosyltransferase
MKSVQSGNVTLSIIIVNYNSEKFIGDCLESIVKYADVPCEIIIVDNGSTDGSAGTVRKFIERECGGKSTRSNKNENIKTVCIFKTGKNTGFAFAANAGAEKAAGDYLLFLNPDYVFFTKGLGNLLMFYKDRETNIKTGAVGAKIINMDGSLQYSCRAFITLARQFYESFFFDRVFKGSKIFGAYFMRWWNHDDIRQVDWLSGALMLISAAAFKEIGEFDRSYFMYSEDTDICFRLSEKGYKNYYYPFFSVKHHDAGIASSNQPLRDMQIWKSRRIYFKKNYSAAYAKMFSFLYFMFIFNRLILFTVASLFGTINSNYKIRARHYLKTLQLYFGAEIK